MLGRVRAEPGSTVLVPVRLTGAVDAREPIRLMVLRPMDRSATAPAAGGTAVDAESEQGVAYATLHRWSVSGISDVQPSGAAGVGRGEFDVEAARWLGLTGVWSVSSVGTDGIGGGGLEGRGGRVGEDMTDGRVGGWLMAINVPWREDQERSRLELVFPEVLLEVRGLTPRSRSLDRLREDLTGPPPGFDGQTKSGVDLLRVLRSWPTERWRATLLTLDTPAHINNRAAASANDAQQNPTERDDVASLNRPAGGETAVLEALSQQIESSWLAALALVSRDDPVLATRLRDRLVLCVRGVDGASSIPAWPTDTDMLDRLLDDLLNDAMPSHWRQERARGWLELQPSVAAWVRSDAYAISGVERHPVSELMIAALSPTAGSFAGSRAGTGVAPAVLTLRSRIGDGVAGAAAAGGVGGGGGGGGGAGQVGASFVALEYAQLVPAEVELWPTDRAAVDAGGVDVAGRSPSRSGDEDLAVGGVEGRAARAAMDAGIGDIVELTSGEWSMSRRAWGRAFPVLRPGVTLGPWRAEARLGSWLVESIEPNDDRAVELGFGPVSGIAGLPGRTGASAGAAGTVGIRSVQDPGWVTAARIYRDPQRETASGWVVYVECRGVGDDTGARGESQRASVVRADTVRVIFGPGAGASHVVAVTEHGVEASFHVPTSRSQQREATVVRHADGWSAWIDVPESAIDPQGILRIAFERVDARGVRSTWPRTCTPWCEDPGRASLDLRAWGEEPNVSTTNTEPGVR